MMKKLMLLILAALCLSSCSVAQQPETGVVTTTKPTTTAAAKPSSTALETVAVETETVTIKKTKPTEPTEKPTKKKATKPTKPVPTQGKTKPNTHVVVTFPKGSFSDSDLVFTNGSIKIKLGEKTEDVTKRLKSEGDITELSEHKWEHDYSNFTLTSILDDNEVWRIAKIEFTDDSIATAKGAKIGMFASQLRKIYGDPFRRSKTAYCYGSEDKMLVFTYEDNMVDGIYYKADLA